MILNISTKTFDLNGWISVQCGNESKFKNQTRRVTKVATLDGGVSIVDMGYASVDTEFEVFVTDITLQQTNQLTYLMNTYPLLNFATLDGYFEGVISSLKTDAQPLSFTVLLKEQLV